MRCLFKSIEKSIVKINNSKHILNFKTRFLYICPHVYHGKVIKISDDTIIKSGDLVAEIHIDNLKAHKLDSDYRKLFRIIKEEFSALSNKIVSDKAFEQIKAYHGTTLLYPIARKQGFTIIDISKGPKKCFLAIWGNILKIVFQKDQTKKNKFRIPKECWISKEQLLEKYIGAQGEINEKKDS